MMSLFMSQFLPVRTIGVIDRGEVYRHRRAEAYLRWMSQRPNIHIIHLTRSHAVEWLKSKYMAKVTGAYMGKQYPDGMKVTIPVHKAVKRLYAKNWLDARLKRLRHSNPYQHILYEDLLKSNYNVTLSVLQFLDCDTTQLPQNVKNEQPVKKQSKGDATNYISNYEQLIQELKKRSLLFSDQE